MAQHTCEDLKPNDTPITFSTFTQASSDHTSNPICAHNSMATQCNQSQYPTLLKQNCAHNPSTNQVSQANLSNSLISQYPPDPGEHVLKKSATEIGEQDFPVKWFKFICPGSKPRMIETSIFTPVHVAYSHIVFMNHQWTINLHDGYPPLHVLLPEEYIPPSLLTLCNFLSPMFHFGDDYRYPTKDTLHDPPSLASPKGEMASSFSWTSLFKSPSSSTLCLGDPTLAMLNYVKLLFETEFYITKYIPLCDSVVHTGTTFLLTSKTLPHKPKMYLQDKHSTISSEVQSEETEEATPIHLAKVYKSLSHGTEEISWQMNAMLLTQLPCPITSTFYPGSKLSALLDHTFTEYLFLCLIFM